MHANRQAKSRRAATIGRPGNAPSKARASGRRGASIKAKDEMAQGPIQNERGGGNVFEDLGLPDASALMAKSELVSHISDVVATRALTDAQGAHALTLARAKYFALTRGDLYGFSFDQLFGFLNALGADIEITVRAPGRSGKRPGIRVAKGRRAGS